MNLDQLRILMEIKNHSGITTSELNTKFPKNKFLKITLSRLRKQGLIQLSTQKMFDPNVNQNVFQYQNTLTAEGLKLIQQYQYLFGLGIPSNNLQEIKKKPAKKISNQHMQTDSIYLKASSSEDTKQDLVMQWSEYLIKKRYSELTDCPPEMNEYFDVIAEEIVNRCIEHIIEE